MKELFKIKWIWLAAISAIFFVAACSEEDDPILPVADFNFDVLDKEVTFSNASKDAQSFTWTFGDGNSSTDISPVHTYENYGDYEVKLVATSTDGTTDEVTKSVSVIDACEIWDGTQTDNLIKGGQFEFCDDKYWNMVRSEQPDHVKYAFGHEDYNPNDGTDGALYIYPDNDDTSEDEATIFYQEIEATSGEYQLDALVKLKGESSADPTSAMTDYWMQIYIGKSAPVDGEDYTDGQTSGWIYGAWTGWAYEIPQTDGPLVHNLLAANVASEEGKFNLDDGKYYVVVKVGKGGAGSFGDGIAIDNLSLKRVGERNACFDWDGTQADNYIKGGQFEECDDKYWTVLEANLEVAPVVFGNTEYTPSTGMDGAAFFKTPAEFEGAGNGGTAGTMYQYIGEFKENDVFNLSAQVKHGGVDGGLSQFWWEMYVWTVEPVEGEEYQPRDPVFGTGDGPNNDMDYKVLPVASYTHAGWGPPNPDGHVGQATVAVDGQIQYEYNGYDQADANGDFTIKKDGFYFFVFKYGTWEGSFGEGIAIDNLSITKKP